MKNKSSLTYSFLLLSIFFASCAGDGIVTMSKSSIAEKGIMVNHVLGINAFEWDFLQDPDNPANGADIFEPKMQLMTSFGQFRHYLDWEKLEYTPGKYTFNQTRSGGWNLDAIYERCKLEGIDALVCIKTIPKWLYQTYPEKEQNNENVPVVYGADRLSPKSYIAQAKVAFQFAARYGSNKEIDSSLMSVDLQPRWNNDVLNEIKIGLNTVKYIECNNEVDKWWKGKQAMQTPEEYAANLSAFYDGDMGKLGKDVGVKRADPNMVVVMSGLTTPDVNYVKAMVEWCRKNRGKNVDGSVNLCFDVINYHLYSNNNERWYNKPISRKRGAAPELTNIGEVADQFVTYANSLNKHMEVWNTESGYDIDESSPQRAIAIGSKTAEMTQADWMLRSSLLYARHGISRAFYYMLTDLNPHTGIFSSSGFISGKKRRPVADYFFQTKKLIGKYKYANTLSNDPVVDVYALGKKKMYVLAVPDEKGRTADYKLKLQGFTKAVIYELKVGANQMSSKTVPVKAGQLTVALSETPIFIQGR